MLLRFATLSVVIPVVSWICASLFASIKGIFATQRLNVAANTEFADKQSKNTPIISSLPSFGGAGGGLISNNTILYIFAGSGGIYN